MNPNNPTSGLKNGSIPSSNQQQSSFTNTPHLSASAQQTEPSEELSESNSVRDVIAKHLPKEAQQSLDRAIAQVNEFLKSGRTYIQENPRESAVIAVTVGISAWVLFATKPGRKVFDTAAETYVPRLAKWMQNLFSGTLH